MYTVLDTNIILLDHTNILTLGKDSVIVLPETVLSELDSFKSNMGELGYQARAFARLVASAAQLGITKSKPCTVAKLLVNNTEVHLVSADSYPSVFSDNPSTANDNKIIHIAKYYFDTYSNVTFMTNDVNCGFHARAKGLQVTDLKSVDQTSFEFTKHLEVSPSVFPLLHNKPIAEVDANYKSENYNYIFKNIDSSQTKIAVIDKGVIDIIGKVSEKELRAQDVNPRGAEQLLLSKAIQTPDIDLIICDSKAGTGKTLIALSNAMKLVRGNNPYQSIIYVRASIDDVDKQEEVGFLSGNSEKFEVYFRPLMDSIGHIVRSRINSTSSLSGSELEAHVENKTQELLAKYNIQCLTGLGLRGRTLTNAIVIIDEVQGQSKASLQKMLTRIGKDCKVIVIGSQNQIDNPYVTKYNNGLSVLLDEAAKPQPLIRMYAIALSKVVRSKFSEWSENIFLAQSHT